MSSSPVLVSCDGLGDLEVGEVAGGEGLSGADDVLWGFPVGVPADGDGVGQVVLGDLEKGVEESWLDDLVSVGEEGVGVTEGEQVLACCLPVLDLTIPLPDNHRSPCRLGYLDSPLPVACLPEEGKAIDEDE